MASLSQSEAELSRDARRSLEIFRALGLLEFFRVPVGPVIHGGVRKKNPLKGLGDFLVWFKNGPVVVIELKTVTGRLEESQVEVKAKLEAIGHEYLVARNIGEFDIILAKFTSVSTKS